MSTLRITGLFDAAQNEATLRRRHAPEDLIPPEVFEGAFLPPPRPISSPPNLSGLVLQLSLGERISGGRVGDVYRVSVESVLTKDGDVAPDIHIPPLVVKIAKRRYVHRLAREAWFYDELEPLQGVATARCFGWSDAQVPLDVKSISWIRKRDDDRAFIFESDENEEVSDADEALRIKERLGSQDNNILSCYSWKS